VRPSSTEAASGLASKLSLISVKYFSASFFLPNKAVLPAFNKKRGSKSLLFAATADNYLKPLLVAYFVHKHLLCFKPKQHLPI
jgi:hypothetical protein